MTCKMISKPAILSAAGGKHKSLRNSIGVRLTAVEIVENKLYQSRDFIYHFYRLSYLSLLYEIVLTHQAEKN